MSTGMAYGFEEDPDFTRDIQPLFERYCVSCHGPTEPESGVRLDTLDAIVKTDALREWEVLLEVLEYEEMPPEKAESRPTKEERALLVSWLSKSLNAAKLLDRERNGLTRRLTRDQYRRTLRDLLGLREDIAKILPADAVSREGFRNNAAAMQLSPLQMESYFEIAEEALELCLVDEDQSPTIQNFRIDLGRDCNPDPYKGNLILGAGSKLLSTSHFVLTELDAEKDFPFTPFRMRRNYEFIEGYNGNATVRGLRSYDDLAHSVFCGFRGVGGYPKQQAPYDIHDRGILLRPSKPTDELFGVTNTYGPSPNFKVSLRQLPEHGDFLIHVTASRYADSLTLEPKTPPIPAGETSGSAPIILLPGDTSLSIEEGGVFQLDVTYAPGEKAEHIYVHLGDQLLMFPAPGGGGGMPREIEVPDLGELWFDAVELKLPGDGKIINLNEFELFKGEENIAPSGTITGSGWVSGGDLRPHIGGWVNLLDGDHENVAHSETQADPWFRLDFEGAVQADRLVIWNRPGWDGGQNRELALARIKGAVIRFLLEGEEKHRHVISAPRKRETRAVCVLRLATGDHASTIPAGNQASIEQLVLNRLQEESDLAKQFLAFEARAPYLGVHLGFRRDCGSSFAPVGPPRLVTSTEPEVFSFVGAIRDFPLPALPEANANYLAGVREIAVRSEYVDSGDMPRLLIHSVEFEGPYYETWPPKTHRDLLATETETLGTREHARELLTRFISRAWRRTPKEKDLAFALGVFDDAHEESGEFQTAAEEALLATMASPEFLLLIEASETPDPEPLTDAELASKLSYFFYGGPPDADLRSLAATNDLRANLDAVIDRLIEDPRFDVAIEEFVYQWLQLDKFDTVEVDRDRHKRFRRHARNQLKREPIEFVLHLLHEDLGIANLVESDFLVVNDAVAEYYGIEEREPTGLEFAPVLHNDPNRGGLLTQTAILAGLSDGRESNPVKRGAWLARKIIAEPPADPPPNVPDLEAAGGGLDLSLREKLELHRNQEGCRKCHEKIDPWGIPLESMDAIGFPQPKADPRSELPDGTHVADLNALKSYLANERLDQVAFSFMKHLASYAIGRSLSYSEIEDLRAQAVTLRAVGYRMKDVIRFVVTRDFFLMK
jgi:PAS domain-containing protein